MVNENGYMIATGQNIHKAVSVLAEAFKDDPLNNFVSPKSAYPEFTFRVMAPIFLHDGFVLLAKESKGAALWLPPKVKLASPVSFSIMMESLFSFGIGSIYRGLLAMHIMEKYHVPEDHYYLYAIGTLDEYRNQGVATSLIQPMIERSEKDHLPIYLENTREENLSFYQRHGFKVSHEYQVGKSGPVIWGMVRDPVKPPLDSL